MNQVPANYDLKQLSKHTSEASRSLPGPDYYAALRWVHETLQPDTYIEIGVRAGASLAIARPGTRCVGIDPAPTITFPLPPGTRVYQVTSDVFFAEYSADESLGQDSFDLAFIDGLHLFEQSLRDFVHLESWARKRSVIAIHDCIPLNAITSQRTRVTDFYSGDVWKIAACLKKLRPDLRMATIKTPPTGLCLVAGLDPGSEVLRSMYDSIVDTYTNLDFKYYSRHPELFPPQLPNTQEAVARFLRSPLNA